MDSSTSIKETVTTPVAAPSTPPVASVASPAPLPVVAVRPPMKSHIQKTIRIHVNTTDQPRPVNFNYRQLYKRELKKIDANEGTEAPVAPVSALESADDLFYQELLKKAENYAMDEDDVDDDGSDEETTAVGTKKQFGNEYDFEDPFIDDSEMLLDEPQEYSAPEFDGFFVYHGPLDGHEGSEKNKPAAPKRKAPSKAKTTTPSTSTAKRGGGGTGDKSRKKVSDDHGTEETTKKSTANGSLTTSNATAAASSSKSKKPSTSTPANVSTTAKESSSTSAATTTPTAEKAKPTTSITATTTKKATSSTDQPAKKRKKLDNKETLKEEKSGSPLSLVGSSHEDQEKKKKVTGAPELKPLDPEIEVLMEKLRRDVVHEDFEHKAKFPLTLKPTVLEAGLIMLRKIKTIDENLVYHLMTILPYNRFTLKKFLTTKSGQLRVDELQQEIDELAILLKQTIDKMMPEQQRLFNEKLAQAQATSSEPSNPDEEDPTPVPKFKCNDDVRKILYDIIQTEEQSIHIANQVATHKDSEKKNEGLASDGKARKLMYQRLLSCWPEGWMNSYEMSRQYSQYKAKLTNLSEKKANFINSSVPTTPKATVATPTDAKKRKRTTPQSSPSDEGLRKKQSIAESGIVPPDSVTFTQKLNASQHPVITIDDDDDGPEQPPSWKQSNSMKIEALISGPSSKKSD